MAVERKENDLPKFTSNVVIQEIQVLKYSYTSIVIIMILDGDCQDWKFQL